MRLTRRWRNLGLGLSARFALWATLLVTAAAVVLGVFFVRQQSRQIHESLRARGLALAKNAAYNSEYGVLVGSQQMLHQQLAGITRERDVAYAWVEDANGSVLASAGMSPQQVRSRRDDGKRAEQVEAPRSRMYRVRSGVTVCEVAAPVYTTADDTPGLESSLLSEQTPQQPTDASPARRRIGVVRVGMSHDGVNAAIAGVVRTTALLTGGVVLCAILIVIALGRSVTRPLEQLVTAAQRVARGDLTFEIDDSRRDEMGQLSGVFNNMVRSLRALIKHMQDGIVQIGAASSDIEGLAEQQTASSVDQAVSVEEVTSSLEELAASAAGIADRSESVVTTAEETVAAAIGGQHTVSAALEGMDRIRETVQNIAASSVRLGDRSQKIGDVLNIIQEIASETHLLAVNAAIESAAAGEHGRRFAVVAGEVRRLAERSRASAEEIASLVAEIQGAISASVMATEQGTKEVGVGVELARGVDSALQEIVALIEKTTRTAREISLATQQQRAASDQVVAVIRGIADNARDAAEGMRKASGLVNQLTSLAAGFEEESSRFVFNGEHPPASGPPPAHSPRLDRQPADDAAHSLASEQSS
ncbi:MAG TPA: methyl-accepting chemotaxis protein [Armatimonadota bacterium]|nr:methyl-accepting chemotaxis protein [Armatimonadota bacterium]